MQLQNVKITTTKIQNLNISDCNVPPVDRNSTRYSCGMSASLGRGDNCCDNIFLYTVSRT